MIYFSIDFFSAYEDLFPDTELTESEFDCIHMYYSKIDYECDLAYMGDLKKIWKYRYDTLLEAVDDRNLVTQEERNALLNDNKTQLELNAACLNILKNKGYIAITNDDESFFLVADRKLALQY